MSTAFTNINNSRSVANSGDANNETGAKKESNIKSEQPSQHQQQSEASDARTNTKVTKNTPSSITSRDQASVVNSSNPKINSEVNGSASALAATQAKALSNSSKSSQIAWTGAYNPVLKNESENSQRNTTRPGPVIIAAQPTPASSSNQSKPGAQKSSSQSSLGFLRGSSQGETKSKHQQKVNSDSQHVTRTSESSSKVDSTTTKSTLERPTKPSTTTEKNQDSFNSKRTTSFNASDDGVSVSNSRVGNRNNAFNNNHSRNSNRHHHHHNDNYHNFDSLSTTNLYIRGLDSNTTDNDLYSLCSKFGKITSTKAILDKATGKCKGYGFVDFEAPISAVSAVADLTKRGILVNMAKQQEADPTNLYLANLPLMMTDTELESLLLPFGPVVSTRILFNQSNKQARGVGFARMSSKEQCDEIIAQLNGQLLKGSNEPLLIKFADGAKQRQKHASYSNSQTYSYRSGGSMMGDWRSNNSDANQHATNQTGNRSFRNPVDHMRQNNSIPNSNNGVTKQSHGMSSIPCYHGHHQTAAHSHPMSNSNLNQSQQHQGHHHELVSHSNPTNIRTQSSNTYASFQIPGSMGTGGDGSQWIHPSQAGQPYVIPQMLHPSSLHYMNLATQMQGMQLNPSVAGYISSQQWPMWPNVNAKHSANPNQAQSQMGNGNNQIGYTETD